MITIPLDAIKALLALPVNPYTQEWRVGIKSFYALMDQTDVDWRHGAIALSIDNTNDTFYNQWLAYVDNMVAQGIKIPVDGCQSYWYMKSKTSSWVGLGEHTVIELCYVAKYHDEHHGHATEFFPYCLTQEAFAALLYRIAHDKTIHESGKGYTLERVIELNALHEKGPQS